MNNKLVDKYLKNHAEPEAVLFSEFPPCAANNVLIVPAFDESSAFVERFVDSFRERRVLLIIVVNQPDDVVDNKAQLALTTQLKSRYSVAHQSRHLSLLSVAQTELSILLIERFTEGLRIPRKQGVGLARKIAADCAIAAISRQWVTSNWIGSTDADATLPKDYFQALNISGDAVAAVFDFRHGASGDARVDSATELYEQRLHYYVKGLQYASSRYAFHTIGSCLAFSAVPYCQVRGFPRKSAGEDFYLLNKLAKIGDVATLQAQINLLSRVSARVPFGTGPAVAQIIDSGVDASRYLIYHPEIFVKLRGLLRVLSSNLRAHQSSIEHQIDRVSCQFLTDNGFWQIRVRWQSQYADDKPLRKAIDDWFDGFRTLKYVHYQRDFSLPDVPLIEALQHPCTQEF